MLTLREIFAKVSNHLLTQKVRAANTTVGCSYRLNNLKCAVGCLINDETYDHRIEGCTPSHIPAMDNDTEFARQKLLEVLKANNVDATDPTTSAFLCRLQVVHDLTRPELWAFELETIKNAFFPKGDE